MHRPHRTRSLLLELALALPGFATAQAPAAPATIVEVAKADVAEIAPRRWVPGSVVSREMPAETRSRLFQELFARIMDGTLTLPVASIHALDDIAAAVEASGTAGRVGKVLLRP